MSFANLLNVFVCHFKKGELKVREDPEGFGEEALSGKLFYSWFRLEGWPWGYRN